MSKIRVLLAENEPNDAFIVARELGGVAEVDVAINRSAFVALIKEQWDVVLMDLSMGDLRFSEAMQLLRELHPQVPVIIVTGSVTGRQADEACNLGALRFFTKGIDGVPGLARAVTQVHETAKSTAKSNRDQRLEQLGDLSTGIVHDFNNILAVVMMGCDQLRTRVNPMDERVLDAMLSATKRGAEMTAQILAFARGSNGAAFKTITPEYLLGLVGQIVRTTFPPNIRVEIVPALGTNQVRGDATQLAQVLTNLATNARDAMPRGGTLRITAQNVTRTRELNGPCVVFTVSDTGTGMSEEVLARIWEPFFTTKPPGKGTGLGLPTVKRIVEAHHGVVKVLSGPDGTSFHVHLPVAVPWTSAEERAMEVALGGAGRTVLLVDDQESFLDLARVILEDAGYKVLTACNGPEALSHFRVGQQIDAVITDLAMPTMTGDELARNLRSVGLGVPIIYVSGCDGTLPRDPTPDATLQKPVSKAQLLAKLAEVLTRAQATGKPGA